MLFAKDKPLVPGYTILNSGDTVKGFFTNTNWRINPSTIKFTSHLIENGDTITYSVDQLKGFGIKDFIFERKVVNVLQNTRNQHHLSNSDEEIYKNEELYLRSLIYGDINLYFLKEKDGKDHFFIERNKQIVELVYLVYKHNEHYPIQKPTVTKNYIVAVKKYQLQLKTILTGCSALSDKSFQIDFVESKIAKLINEYNACISSSGSTYSYKKEEWKVYPYINAGLNFANSSFQSTEPHWNSLVEAEFSTSTNFSASFGLKYVFPKLNNRLATYTDLGFNIYSFSAETDETSNLSPIPANYEYIIDYSQITLNYGMYFNLAKSKNTPFIKTGFSTIFGLNINTERNNLDFNNSTYLIEEPRKLQWGFNVGLGYSFSNWSILYQFEMATGISGYSNLKNKVRSNYVLLSYAFNNK